MKIISQFLKNPDPAHWTAVKKIFRYLKKTAKKKLRFKKSEKNINLTAYCNADWTENPDTKKNITAYYTFIKSSAVS